jgi:predicted metal-dependent phosphoesterase TrpH
MLLDLHAYSDLSGDLAIRDAITTAKRRGIDGICFADREHSAETAAAIADGEYDFPVFVGVEVATRSGDAIVLTRELDPYLTREEWRELTSLQRPELSEVIEWADSRGGTVLLSHPYDRGRSTAPRDRLFALSGLSGIEVGNDSSDAASNRVALESVSRSSSPAFGGSAQGRDASGTHWFTLFSNPVKSQGELVEAVKQGDFWAVEVSLNPFEQRRRQPRPERGSDRGERRPRSDGGRRDKRPRRRD